MIHRKIEEIIKNQLTNVSKIIVLYGARQAGKTTLIEMVEGSKIFTRISNVTLLCQIGIPLSRKKWNLYKDLVIISNFFT